MATWYAAGTATFTNGSATVTGVGTAWILNASLGEEIRAPDGKGYEITAITADGTLTIDPAYLGSTAAGATYKIVPVRGADRKVQTDVAALIAESETMLDGIGQGKLGDGALLDLVLKFTADPDCGVYRNADNDWVLVAGGNDILRLKSAGATLVLESVSGDAIQSTTTDTTAGRLMGVGAFGLGAMGQAPSIADFTVELAAGFYRYLGGGAGATGSPDSGAWNGSCIICRGVGERITFLAIRESASSPKMWMGTRVTDTGAISWLEVAFQDAEPAFTSIDLNGNIVGGAEVTIADDAVAIITPPRKGGFANVTCNGNGDYMQLVESGLFLFDVGLTPNIADIYTGTKMSSSTADVIGTTGIDGEVTFAVQADVVKIENRSGSSRTFQVTFT